MRTCQKMTGIGKWNDIEFKNLKNMDVFRLFDDGVPVIDRIGCDTFIAKSDTYLNSDGIYQIDIFDAISEK